MVRGTVIHGIAVAGLAAGPAAADAPSHAILVRLCGGGDEAGFIAIPIKEKQKHPPQDCAHACPLRSERRRAASDKQA